MKEKTRIKYAYRRIKISSIDKYQRAF